MSDCLFCRLARKEIPTQIVYEDDEILAFKDIAPQAPVHIVWISKKHIEGLDEISPEDQLLLGKILLKMSEYAKSSDQLKDGYRVCTNIGYNGGQTVRHLHFHLLGGKVLEQTMA